MNTIRAIRDRLQVSQEELGKALGCTQGNISLYERGQTVPPEAAKKLIAFAAQRGYLVTYDEIYGEPSKAKSKHKAAA